MRIVCCIRSLEGGGAEKVLVTLAKGFAASGHSVSVAVFRPINVFERELMPIVPDMLAASGFLAALKKVFLLRRYFLQRHPDIILAFMWNTNILSTLAWILAGRPGKLVLTEHVFLTRHLDSERYRSLKKLLISSIQPLASAVVAVSAGVADDLSEKFSMPAAKIKVIHNPIDISLIKEKSRDPVDHPWFRNGDPLIVSACRLTPQKGLHVLFQAFAKMRPPRTARLAVVGDGELRGMLEKTAAELNISDRVSFFGHQENPFRFMARATVFVQPSIWEGFGNTIVEAMACGVPVIATSCPYGPEEILENGRSGCLVQPGDPDDLFKALERLLMDESERSRLKARAEDRYWDFDITRIIPQYLKMFDELVS